MVFNVGELFTLVNDALKCIENPIFIVVMDV